MTPTKRVFDITLAIFGAVLFAVPAAILAIFLLVGQGRPIFYLAERMKTPDQSFWLWKFRTMHVAIADGGVSGGDKTGRVTRIGKALRQSRLDELPQIWNILRGDMSFVGPRPPLRSYVERRPDLYGSVLKNRPGLTGLATLVLHQREERLLAACTTALETETIYMRRCVPIKARVDMIYQRKQNFMFDLALLVRTVFRIVTKTRAG